MQVLIGRLRIGLSAILLLAIGSAAHAGQSAQFAPASSTLEGRVLYDFVYYQGGTEKAMVLWLSEPITIEGNPNSKKSKRTVNDVSRILLEAASADLKLEDLAGKTATLEGTLYREPSELHHTEMLMKVERVIDGGN